MTDPIYTIIVTYAELFRKDISNPSQYTKTLGKVNRGHLERFAMQCRNFDVDPLAALKLVKTFNKDLQLFPNQLTSKLFWSKHTQAVKRVLEASAFSKTQIFTVGTDNETKIRTMIKNDRETIKDLMNRFGLDERLILKQFINEVSPYYVVCSSVGRAMLKNGEIGKDMLPTFVKAHREIRALGGYKKFRFAESVA